MLEQLLRYWYNLEFFQPNWPVKEKKDINLLQKPLPWPPDNPDSRVQISYDIYLGCATAFDLITWTLGMLSLVVEDSPIERDMSKVCLCALKVDEDGMYVANSFAISTFAWALGNMVQSKNFSVKLDLERLEQLLKKFNADIASREAAFTIEELKTLYINVCASVGIEHSLFTPSIWACKKIQYAKNGEFPPLGSATELMQSYYVREIEKVKKNPGKQVKQYAEALYARQPKRTMIDSDIDAMREWLKADRFPKGAWPSKFSPSLMQQLAINLTVSGMNLFSVNGPPGTGKTTLLKEIVTSNIVQRAELMAAYAKPDDAFKKKEFKSPPDQYNRVFYSPDKVLTAYGMLVASNNNAAMENISIALPKSIKKDRTGHFSNTENIAETYFADVASALLDEPAWGLISVRLGKKENIGTLKKKLWWSKTEITLKSYYDQPAPDWNIAKQRFTAAMDAVNKERDSIARAQQLLSQYTEASTAEQTEAAKMAQCQAAINEQHKQYEALQLRLNDLEDSHLLQKQNSELLKASLSRIKRLSPGLFKKDAVVQEWQKAEHACAEILISITRLRTEMHACEKVLDNAKLQAGQQETAVQRIQEKKLQLTARIESDRIRFGNNFADSAFWQNICSNETSQAACPWTNMAYDTLREELFYRALMLQKAFVLGSNCVKQNLYRLFAMWDGLFTKEDRNIAYGSLLNTLFLVIPVISTTFASVQNFLDGVQPGELGMLVIDESGQATPQSALGALWRTQSAIVVGDPLQVEPIMTTPIELCKRFADDNALPSIYRIPELSVQMLADAQNPFGGMREVDGSPLWLGCPLVVHRRCIEPMFSMSNQVAYEGRMFCKTDPPSVDKRFLLEQSTWFDVNGDEVGNKNHTVPRQIEYVTSLMEKAIDQFEGLPNLYIITPFTSVKRSLEQKLRPLLKRWFPDMDAKAVDDWLSENCGTIHTFQGKEANEVLIVLGCDRQKGMSAARWVGQKPNMINVAVSRAQYRVCVIGSYDLWKNIPYVQTICDMLKDNVLQEII